MANTILITPNARTKVLLRRASIENGDAKCLCCQLPTARVLASSIDDGRTWQAHPFCNPCFARVKDVPVMDGDQ